MEPQTGCEAVTASYWLPSGCSCGSGSLRIVVGGGGVGVLQLFSRAPHLASGRRAPLGWATGRPVWPEEGAPMPGVWLGRTHPSSFLEAHLFPYLFSPVGVSAKQRNLCRVAAAAPEPGAEAAVAAGSPTVPSAGGEGRALHRCHEWPGVGPGGCFLHLHKGEVEAGPQDTGPMGGATFPRGAIPAPLSTWTPILPKNPT